MTPPPPPLLLYTNKWYGLREERRLECVFRVCINARIRNGSIGEQEILKALKRRDILIFEAAETENVEKMVGCL